MDSRVAEGEDRGGHLMRVPVDIEEVDVESEGRNVREAKSGPV